MKRKTLQRALAAFISVSLFGQSITPVYAVEVDSIRVEKTNNNLVLGNQYLEREFTYADGKLITSEINNLRADETFIPGDGSEEFIIKLFEEKAEKPTIEGIDRSKWTATASSQQNNNLGDSDGPAANLIDGDVNTIWHSNYSGTPQQYPHWVEFDLQEETSFKAFSYTPRQQGEDTNGNILGYELYVSNDLETITDSENLVAQGNFKYDGVNQIVVNLNKEAQGRYVRLVATSSKNGQAFAGGAEFNLHKDIIEDDEASTGYEIKTSDLTLDVDNIKVESTNVVLNNEEKEGKIIEFPFETYETLGVEFDITQKIVMYEGDHYMRKFIEIESSDTDIRIDYIDCESLNVNEEDATWTIPTDAGGIVEMETFKANLGQPVYIQGMFFGSEFPLSDTQIVDDNARMRYYSGKNFGDFERDNQLTTEGEYVTWQTVVGAARSTEQQVIQSDFYDYIDDIATPTDFRIQYNSWFDNMMLIDDQNILESFIEIDKQFSSTGIRPLDSYVVDDGWINYNDTNIVDANRAGTTLNESGFWEFNSKFPNKLYPSSELVQNFGSNFGVWVGPRGGYNFYGHLANILTKSGKGSKAGGSIDVADRTYIENLIDMFIEFQTEYQVNYWKWDGFSDNAQYNSFRKGEGVVGRENNHMYGGYKGMYHVTDLWEAWIDLFEIVRDHATDEQINKLWLSLTCYVNPSPWFLQWANSVWLQCIHDRGDAGPISGYMDRMLTYRDAAYYDFIHNHEFQFPLANIYNHDPVYGKEGTGMNANSMTDEQFQNYLYMMATRGTAFWELYYSADLLSEGKYLVNAEFLEWAEENFHILRNAKMFGGNPDDAIRLGSIGTTTKNETYGFSAWDGTEGIISMRNPNNVAQELTFVLDRNLGVGETNETFYRTVVNNYNVPEGADDAYQTLQYGDTVTVTLQPGETRIWKLSTVEDTVAPTVEKAQATSENEIIVKFTERVVEPTVTVAGHNVASVERLADKVTYKVTLADSMTSSEKVTISVAGAKDASNNVIGHNSTELTYYADYKVYEAEDVVNGTIEENVYGKYGYSVAATVDTANLEGNTALAKQEGAYEIGIDAEGKPYFQVDEARATASVSILDGEEHQIVGVKENNGLIKVYVDGTLNKSDYELSNVDKYVEENNTEILNSMNYFAVFNKSLGYDEVADLLEGEVEDSKTALDPSEFTVEVPSSGDSTTPENIFVEDPSVYWITEEYSDGIENNAYVTIDLNGLYNINGFDYTKRYHSSVNYDCTGSLLDYILEVSNDGGETWKQVAAGETTGATTEIRFDEVAATHIRLKATQSYHWQSQNANKFMAVGYVQVYGEKLEVTNVALDATVTGKWTNGDDLTLNNDRPLSMITDGIKDNVNGNYGEFGQDGKKESSYVEIDLGKLYTLENMNLYRYWADGRIYDATVIEVSSNPNFTNSMIVYNSDADNVHGKGAGTDELYAETATGKAIEFDKVNAQYVRIYMYGSNKGTTNHVNELEIFGMPAVDNSIVSIEFDAESKTGYIGDEITLAPVVTPVDYVDTLTWTSSNEAVATVDQDGKVTIKGEGEAIITVTARNVSASIKIQGYAKEEGSENTNKLALEIAVELALEVTEAELENVVPAVVNEFKAALAEAQSVLENDKATQDEIDQAFERLRSVMEMLSFEKGDKTQLEALIEKIDALDSSKYITNTWDKLAAKLEASKAVIADENAMAEEVANSYEELLRAFLELRLKPNKDLLEELINKVENMDLAKYTEESVVALQNELRTAKEIFADENSTKEDIELASANLTKAVNNLVEIASGENEGGNGTSDNEITDNETTGSTVNNNSGSNNSGNSSTNGNAGKGEGKLPQTGGVDTRNVLFVGIILLGLGAAFMFAKKSAVKK